MDHSLRGYLGRRTTEELDHILKSCLEQKNPLLDEDVILMILDILWGREKDLEAEVPPGLVTYWERLKSCPKDDFTSTGDRTR